MLSVREWWAAELPIFRSRLGGYRPFRPPPTRRRTPCPERSAVMTYRPPDKALRLAVVLRNAQWAIDDAAYKLPMGIYPPSHCAQLATDLEQVVTTLKNYADSPEQHIQFPSESV